jgi:hypothetical protein
MTTFNIFTRIRYLPRFFGVWTLEIVPILDNMVWKVIDHNSIAMNTYAHTRREAAFQFFNVNNKAYFPYLVGDDVLEHWIQFQTENY